MNNDSQNVANLDISRALLSMAAYIVGGSSFGFIF